MMWIDVDNGAPAIRVGGQPKGGVTGKARKAYGKIMQAGALVSETRIFT
jgi:hypothetical protein